MEYRKWLHRIAFGLVIFGAIDLGLFGLFPIPLRDGAVADIIDYFFGGDPGIIAVIIFTLIGISGVYLLVTHFSTCKTCEKKQ